MSDRSKASGKKFKDNTSQRTTQTNDEPKQEERSFMYMRYLHHPGLAQIQYKNFFHKCRLQNISFDIERKQGSTFLLQDCLQSGVIAMMTIAEDRKDSLNMMVDSFKFLESQAGNAGQLAL